MYDAGGISLKPSDAMHALMKLDMSGAARDLRGDGHAPRPGLPGDRHRLPDVHRQHALGDGDAARRRPDHPRRQDRRGRQRRRRGSAGDGRRHRPGHRGRGRRHRHHRDPDRRRDAHVRVRARAGAGHGPGARRPAARGRRRDRRAALGAAPRPRPIDASSTRRSPTSRTWAARTPGRSPPACSSQDFAGGDPVRPPRHLRARWSPTATRLAPDRGHRPSGRGCWRPSRLGFHA